MKERHQIGHEYSGMSRTTTTSTTTKTKQKLSVLYVQGQTFKDNIGKQVNNYLLMVKRIIWDVY